MARLRTAKNPDPATLLLMEGIAKLLSQGLTQDQVSRQVNIAKSDLKTILLHPEFEPYYKKLDPKGYKTWKEAKTARAKREQVKTAAAQDASEYYARARKIVLESDELKDKERLDVLLKLLSMSDVMGEGVVEEIIHLSPHDRQVIQEALGEQELPRRTMN